MVVVPLRGSRPVSGAAWAPTRAYVRVVIDLLVHRALDLARALCDAEAEYVSVHDTVAECDRCNDGCADSSSTHRRHGVNLQVVTDPRGMAVWISRALPGRTHDVTSARTHRIAATCTHFTIAARPTWPTSAPAAPPRRRPDARPARNLRPGRGSQTGRALDSGIPSNVAWSPSSAGASSVTLVATPAACRQRPKSPSPSRGTTETVQCVVRRCWAGSAHRFHAPQHRLVRKSQRAGR
ncbi:transposase family protein [Streptomyces sp. NPDC026673]|uniref:transposase family protein n=1 Tax=Streptomyces sp. NPDC026673 TaxID=3155724 RepID=UPI003400B094